MESISYNEYPEVASLQNAVSNKPAVSCKLFIPRSSTLRFLAQRPHAKKSRIISHLQELTGYGNAVAFYESNIRANSLFRESWSRIQTFPPAVYPFLAYSLHPHSVLHKAAKESQPAAGMHGRNRAPDAGLHQLN